MSMNRTLVASVLRAAAEELAGEPSVREALEQLLDRTGKTEELLAALADIYKDKAATPEYADRLDEMGQTEQLLRVASRAIKEVWEPSVD